ncbi:hypothetical protein G6O67_001775 [Ophiocordyceps sinensis]|uniref:Uncharacterized protein n=1 Tax=Ophiocordyceps sinensis TaxID=72228 RepID=A0A8H4PSY5_9HYPO|nr:hypothetical protein G6O67_001775 [Ophiocordyceps sinensis]
MTAAAATLPHQLCRGTPGSKHPVVAGRPVPGGRAAGRAGRIASHHGRTNSDLCSPAPPETRRIPRSVWINLGQSTLGRHKLVLSGLFAFLPVLQQLVSTVGSTRQEFWSIWTDRVAAKPDSIGSPRGNDCSSTE